MGAMTLALTAGGLAALTSVAESNAQKRQARYQQKVAEANAEAARNQAKITEAKGRVAGENLDRERSALRREYADLQAGNVAGMGALGVDMSSGSALRTLEGNALRFAQNVGANRYQKALSDWETRQNVNAALTNAKNYEAQASHYGSTVSGLGSTLLTAGLSGLVSGLSAYSMAGGFGGAGEAAGGAVGSATKTAENPFFDRALGRWTSTPVRH